MSRTIAGIPVCGSTARGLLCVGGIVLSKFETEEGNLFKQDPTFLSCRL